MTNCPRRPSSFSTTSIEAQDRQQGHSTRFLVGLRSDQYGTEEEAVLISYGKYGTTTFVALKVNSLKKAVLFYVERQGRHGKNQLLYALLHAAGFGTAQAVVSQLLDRVMMDESHGFRTKDTHTLSRSFGDGTTCVKLVIP